MLYVEPAVVVAALLEHPVELVARIGSYRFALSKSPLALPHLEVALIMLFAGLADWILAGGQKPSLR